jgi:hypothetical protein
VDIAAVFGANVDGVRRTVALLRSGVSVRAFAAGVGGGAIESCPYRASIFVGGAYPGLHPGLVELALQAGIAAGAVEIVGD